MTSSELVKVIHNKTNVPIDKVKQALDDFQSIISDELASGNEVQIPGFGNFVIVNYPARSVQDPSDRSKLIQTQPKNVAKFKPHPELTQAVKSQQSSPENPTINFESVNIPYADLSKVAVSKKILTLIPEHLARHYQAVPIGEKDGKIQIAMIDPEDREAVEFIKKRTGKELSLFICTQSDLNHILDQYSGISAELKQIVDSVGDEEIITAKDDTKNALKQEEIIESAPAAKIVQSLIRRAVREGASDIHVEPTEAETIVRFRIDGVLKKIINLPIEILPAVVSRIKILSGMKIDETRLPQDGRFQTVIDQAEVDFRVSTFPTVNGEKVVARILDKSGGVLTLEQLGLRGRAFDIVESNIHKSHGMILVTGPTGSGKTTTLYAVITKIKNETVNIVTLEDPVEYRIATINQGQVNADIGFSFANGLRSILRQDPNVIMIGEIRDFETAEMAVHSALTGHIVLSTLHTNDAAGALPRLIDMKIEPFLINSSLNAVIAQRLCRKVCDNCREQYEPIEADLIEINKEIEAMPQEEKRPDKITLFKGKGCDNCNGTGYKGRIGIFEVFELSNKIKELVGQRSSGTVLDEEARKEGMLTMRQDGVLKAIEGLTTLEEVYRVTKE